jgi:hypothetical protein
MSAATAALSPFLLAAALPLVCVSLAHARPPDNADPALAPWFRSLHTAQGGACCSLADCRPVQYRTLDNHYEVLIGKQYGSNVEEHWEVVPPDSVLNKTDNPTGSAIACWTPYTHPRILCFVRPAEG